MSAVQATIPFKSKKKVDVKLKTEIVNEDNEVLNDVDIVLAKRKSRRYKNDDHIKEGMKYGIYVNYSNIVFCKKLHV